MNENQEIVRNLEILIALIEAYPQSLFDLDAFQQVKSCGTLYCSVGLAASQPYFQFKGLTLSPASDLMVKGKEYWGGMEENDKVLDSIFGKDSFHNLFQPAGQSKGDAEHSDYDEEFGYDSDGNDIYFENTTDKELALWRLKRQLAIYKEKV